MKTKRKPFTLLELLTAMTVFTILMLAVMRFMGLTQDVVSSATGSTRNVEMSRVIMDLIANDLKNIYYEEGVDTLCYYSKFNDGDDTISLDLAVYRPTKVGTSKTRLTWVRYEFDKDDKCLKMFVVGDDKFNQNPDDSKWNLYRVSSTATDLFPSSKLESKDGAVILEGVTSFKVIPYKVKSSFVKNKTESFERLAISNKEYPVVSDPTEKRRIPDMVRIEAKLVNPDVWRDYKEYKSNSIGKEPDIDGNSRVYSREVVIDRGQF